MITSEEPRFLLPKLSGIRILSLSVSLLLISVLFFLVVILAKSKVSFEEEVTVRKIETAVIPPPPPPPPPIKQESQQSDALPTINLNSMGDGTKLQFSKKPMIEQIKVAEIEKPEFEESAPSWKQTLSVDFPEVEMKDLDEIPRLISRKDVSIPLALKKKGIKKVRVKIVVMIDESGRTYLRKIVDAVHPEMEPAIRELIKSTRFTPPTKDGFPVHAVYSWAIRFIDRV